MDSFQKNEELSKDALGKRRTLVMKQGDAMYLIQLFLPLYSNRGEKFSALHYREVRDELVEKFGGITAYTRSPAQGLWQPDEERSIQDDLVTYEVMAPDLERPWWRAYKARLEHRFQQQEILIRAQAIELLQ